MGMPISAVRRPYAPPFDPSGPLDGDATFLGTGDPTLIRVTDGPADADDDVQIAQQRPNPPAPRRQPQVKPAPKPQPPLLSPQQQMAEPGRGYGVVPQAQVERGMTPTQRMVNRSQALREYANQQPPPGEELLPDDWERTKAPDLVDDIRRAAQRHGVPLQMLARLLYQEGKFNEPDKLKKPLVMSSEKKTVPIGWAQMTQQTLNDLKRTAELRGDTARLKELQGYSLANREQAFDAAAEQLAYARRMTGSWHAAAASYNTTPYYIAPWLRGANVTSPENLWREKDGPPGKKWEEMKKYLAIVMRGTADAHTPDMYEGADPVKGFRVASRIPPFSSRAISGDTRDNP